MICEKCNHLNDALSTQCVNCGNDFSNKTVKKLSAEINGEIYKKVMIFSLIIICLWVLPEYPQVLKLMRVVLK